MQRKLNGCLGRLGRLAVKRLDMEGQGMPSLSGGVGGDHLAAHRIVVEGDEGDSEFDKAAALLSRIMLLRDKYKSIDSGEMEPLEAEPQLNDVGILVPAAYDIVLEEGVYSWTRSNGERPTTKPVPWDKYVADFKVVFQGLDVGPHLSACRTRLQMLEEKFELYSRYNAEHEATMSGGCGVFGTATKVDNSVGLSTSMTAPQLLSYIRRVTDDAAETREKSKSLVVRDSSYTQLTFLEALRALGVEQPHRITIEGLGLHPPIRKRFRRFDILDPELNKAGAVAAEILNLFLQPRTLNGGKYFADIVRRNLEAHERAKHHPVATEYKINLNGSSLDEWPDMARWLCREGLLGPSSGGGDKPPSSSLPSHYVPSPSDVFKTNMFVVRINRISSARTDEEYYHCRTNMDQLTNIFLPMFQATARPHENKELTAMLERVGAINVISDEVVRKRNLHQAKSPDKMPWSEDPDDYYFWYYVWANLCSLNAMRKRRGMNTIQFRPTCGETTPHWDQLVVSYLLADGIMQGVRLEKSWVLQYLYLFHRIGICMSPLSNNGMAIPYAENPFKLFFKRGLRVSLATEDPLHYHHHSQEPLIEEYATAKKVFNLTSIDMAEIARNSILISSFPHDVKRNWLGDRYLLDDNDARKSGVPDCRLAFRLDCLVQEQSVLNYALSKAAAGQTAVFIAKFKQQRPHGAGGEASAGRGTVAIARTAAAQRQRLDDLLREHHHRLRRYYYTDPRVHFPRIDVIGPIDHDVGPVRKLHEALRLRQRYQPAEVAAPALLPRAAGTAKSSSVPAAMATSAMVDVTDDVQVALRQGGTFVASDYECDSYYGVILISRRGKPPHWPTYIPKIDMFIADVADIKTRIEDEAVKDLALHRLGILEHKFGLHLAMNIGRETGIVADKEHNNRDFFTARKVDNNTHTDSGMNARSLFHFFMEKAKNAAQDVVQHEEGQNPVTLGQLLTERLKVNLATFTVDELTSLLRSDKVLHDLFLTTNDYTGGRYFAELTKRTLRNYSLDQYTYAENRLVIRGRGFDEWNRVAEWFSSHGMASPQVRWMVQLPRCYSELFKDRKVKNFGEYLENIFMPLWQASLHWERHAKLHYFLSHISGFDTVFEEQLVDPELRPHELAPHDWRHEENPAYNYYLYYFWSNLSSLNAFRKARGFSTFTLRPQCGEAGSIDHLVGGFLLAHGINHGVNLRLSPPLEYLFYIAQIGIAMSPLSNTSTAVAYLDNPFPKFFSRGLNVSLATNKPLDYHFTQEPLIEEYSVAAKVWKLSFNDLSEVAKNSVLQSGFPDEWKVAALGSLWRLKSVLGNQVRKSHVSDIRIAFRFETYHAEINFLDDVMNQASTFRAYAAMRRKEIEEEEAAAAAKETPLRPEPEEEEAGANSDEQGGAATEKGDGKAAKVAEAKSSKSRRASTFRGRTHLAGEFIPRANLSLDAELSVYEEDAGVYVTIPYTALPAASAEGGGALREDFAEIELLDGEGGGHGDDDDDDDGSAEAQPRDTVQRQVEELNAEITRVKISVRATEWDSNYIALQVKRLREMLQQAEEGFKLDAKLATS